jgi:predicted permease
MTRGSRVTRIVRSICSTVESWKRKRWLASRREPRRCRGQPLIDGRNDFAVNRNSQLVTRKLMNDLRFAVRQLLKQPGFTLVAVLTLALGIGANATIRGMIHVFFFKPLPVRSAERLAFVMQKTDVVEFPHGFAWPDYRDLKDRVEPFEDLLAAMMSPANVGAAGRTPNRTWIEYVSGNYFAMLGVPAALGQTWLPEQADGAGAEPVVVLSHAYWQRQFGGDPSLIGSAVVINGQPVTVIGVMSEAFTGAQWSLASSAWVPAGLFPRLQEGGEALLESRDAPAFRLMARLRTGVTVAEARAAADVAVQQLVSEHRREHRPSQVMVVREMRSRPEPSFSAFMPLAAAVFLALVLMVLLIACANVANLMFARAVTRQKEMGIRTAVGASRLRLIRQLLIESALLGVLACAVGSAFAQVFGTVLSGFTPAGDMPIRTEASWSWPVFGITLLLSVVAGILAGFAPALRATRLELQAVLKEGGGTLHASSRHPLRSLLVVGQTALCVAVLTCGGLFLESLRQVTKEDLGFKPEGLVMASVDLNLQNYTEPQGKEFYRQLLERLEALPGVQGATLSSHVPFDYGMRLSDVAPEGTVATDTDQAGGMLAVGFNAVSTHYLRTLGISLLQGRGFDETDAADAPRVLVVNQALARRLWGEDDPIGKRLRFGRGGDLREVVGVVRQGKYLMLNEEPRPFVFVPLAQDYSTPATLQVRAGGDPLALVPAIRQVLGELDSDLPIYNVRTMEEHLRQSALAYMPLRMAATLAGVQGLLGLALALMGIYGVVAYVVSRRTREIGIRLALGAQRWDVLRCVMREGWRLTVLGLTIGLGAALLTALGLSRLLYGLNPLNLPVFGGVLAALGGTALLACYLPARRALRVDPLEALRSE